MNVGDLLTRAARRYGDRVAVVDGARQVGFRELDDRSDRLASALLDRGLAPGDRIAVLVGNELEWFDATFGLLKAGMVRTYVNPRSAAPEITFQLEDCDPAAVIVSADHAHLLDKVDLGSVKHVIETGASYEAMLANGVSGRRSMPVEESDLAAIMYSSGTTGRPKGTLQTHGNWLAHTKSALIELNPAADDV